MNIQTKIELINSTDFVERVKRKDIYGEFLIIDNNSLYFYNNSRFYIVLYPLYKNIFQFDGFQELKESFIWKFPVSQNIINFIFNENEYNISLYYNAEIDNYVIDKEYCGADKNFPAIIVKYTRDFNKEIQQDIYNIANSISLNVLINHERKVYMSYLWYKEICKLIYVNLEHISNSNSNKRIPYLMKSI